MNGTHLGYVLMGFPRVSETFIASELLRVERAGVPVRLFVIKPVEERERRLRHPVVDAIRAEPVYLPDPRSLTAPLHRWRPAHLRAFAPAIRRTLRRRPRGLARAAGLALGQALRDRRRPLSGPRKIYVKELVQAIALADELLAAPDVRHLHAHFAHGTTTITWLAARITGLPFSFTGHARDIYAPDLNPRGWLRRKLLAAEFAVTCTAANVAHLRRIAPEADIRLVYHGLNADFTRLLEAPAPPRAVNGTLRVLGVGRLVAKKGFDVLVEACAVLDRRGVPFEALIVGQDDKHGEVVGAAIRRHGLDGRVRLPGPVSQSGAARGVPAGDRAVHAVPAAAGRPRRHPQRVGGGDGRRRARGRERGVGHPRADHGRRQRAHRRTGGPGGARRRVDPPASRPRARGAAGGGGKSDGARAIRRGPPGRRTRRAIRAGGRQVRPVVCVIEHLHRDRELAESVAAGHFTHVGETRPIGREPDWLGADLPADEEWRIEWVKFYYGLDLAHAYRTTGAQRFREAWERLVASWIRQVPPDHDSSDVTARRILNWIYAWQGFGAGALDAPLEDEHRRTGAPRASDADARAQPPHARALRAADRRARRARPRP